MKKNLSLLFIAIVTGMTSCSTAQTRNTKSLLTDKKATTETEILYTNLHKTANKGILFGHQDDLAYGVNWKYEAGRSDVKDVTGDYPAVYGWDMTGVEKDAKVNIDNVPFDKMIEYIKDGHKRGGVITMSWHFDNPLTDKNAWDTTPKSLASAIPGGTEHEKYKTWLDKGARFFLSLKDEEGKLIPILFRPYHELSGNWFWWCQNNASPEEFKILWKFTVDYLKQKGVHNLIYVYNTSPVKTREDYLKYYPGSDYVDVLSFDNYQYTDPKTDNTFIANSLNMLKIIDQLCKEQHKLMALAETGYEGIPFDKWWTNTLIKSLGDYKISYVLVWRNHGWQEKEQKMHYYAPFKGQISEKDFIKFHNLDKILFEKDAAKINLYKK
jgi:mannan endo-1,4-beta-mannosidase